MDITSLAFITFIVCIIPLYYLTSPKIRHLLLIPFSLLFIATYDIGLLVFLIGYIIVNHLLACLLSKDFHQFIRKTLLFVAVILDIFILSYFKYLYFFISILNHTFPSWQIPLSSSSIPLIIPLGMSFFTFKAISFLVDVYRNPNYKKSFISFFAYIIFFPEFLSGPIERFSNFIISFSRPKEFSYLLFLQGSSRILLGLFKKVVIANNISTIITPVFSNLTNYQGFDLLLSTYLFSLQIYFDFSGYSDIAIGIGKLLGFSIPENFNNPYFSSSIKEFWLKWHISLSSWFRDYLYIPLGGNRKGFLRQLLNIMVIFLFTGIWHGAGINFIIWGLLHGTFLIIPIIFTKYTSSFFKINQSLKRIIGIIITFNLVNFFWVFFKTKTFSEASYIFSHLLPFQSIHLNINSLYIPFLLSVAVFAIFTFSKRAKSSLIFLLFGNLLLLLGIFFFSSNETHDFLYFKF